MNKTTYTKGFYVWISLYKIKHSFLASIGMFQMATSITVGMGMMANPATKTDGWWAIFSGAVINPIIVFLIPFIVNMNNYRKMVKDNNGNDIDVSIELTDNKIVLRNSMIQNSVISYSKVKEILNKNGMIIIELIDGDKLYFGTADYCFIGCTKDEFLDKLRSKTQKKVFDV